MSHHNPKSFPEHNTLEMHAALVLHGLDHDKPSMMADAFRFGWMARKGEANYPDLVLELQKYIKLDLSNVEAAKAILSELTNDQ